MRFLQRVTNCVLTFEDKALLLQKPSRGWWVAPGGKMEPGESIKESAEREFWEETGLKLEGTELRAVFTIVMMEHNQPIKEWMMFTFQAKSYHGEMMKESPEGKLKWQPFDELVQLPMAEGDKHMFRHVLSGKGIMYGTFYYTPDFDLLSYRLEPNYT
ncbi:8-oxo-dGTP diphosphatase [Halalkalibacter nanhaiisediminis]|uniref:8-oxo-dGTP diphosphatase n=1 Tax=Halalkalibacter nanhaiisediminis TaxID=688079 RepID=A0A562QTC6_9BACI|nr:8-oxo-dGTP diphosphatase [Halalkalibacter nanhaiisediminis]